MNNELCDTPYLVVDMPQDQSSFADPPWLENPPLSIFWSKWRTAAEKEQEYVERKELIQQLAGQMEGDVDRAKQVVRNKVKAEARKEARIIEKALEAYVRRHEHEEGKKKGEVPVLPPFCQPVVAPVAAEEEKKKKRTFEDMMREKKVLFVPRKKKKTKKAFSGGLVLEPEPKFYCKPEETVVTLDFGALYPSIIEAERFGYMTLVWDRRWLEDPRARKKFVPINETQCCVYVTHYDDVPVSCIVTEIVHEVNGNRKKIKRKMKTEKDPFQYAALNAAQLTAKVVANSVYGFLGSKTSGLTVTALAASVCAVGRWMNKTARHFVMVRGNRVVYGDTDSIFVIYKVPVSLLRLPRGPERWEKIKQWIYMRAERDEIDLTALYRAPNKMEFETTKDPIMLTKNKKTYTAWEFGEKFGAWRNPKPKVLIKGFAFNKRDKCAFAREIGHFAVRRLLAQQLDGIVPDLREKLLQFEPRPTSMEQLQPYVITIEFATSYKSETVIGPHLAQQYQEETGVRPIPGQRMPYVVARHEDERLHYESTVTLRGLLKRRMHLDPSYYLLTQVLKSLAQLFGQEKELLDRITRMIEQVAAHFETIVADVPTFQKMRRWSRASRSTPCFSQE